MYEQYVPSAQATSTENGAGVGLGAVGRAFVVERRSSMAQSPGRRLCHFVLSDAPQMLRLSSAAALMAVRGARRVPYAA